MNCGCDEYTRSQAGNGLPAIEPGMPLPAGTGLTRRSFISRASGLALAVYGAASLGPKAFEEGIAAATAAQPHGRVLVSLFMSGGVDSLTLLAPTGHPRYATLRPTLAMPASDGTAFSDDPSLRWHSSAGALSTLHDEGKLTVLPAVGYTSPNQSHFTSRHYWEVGEVNPFGRWGWLGRYLDRHGAPDNPLQGLTLGWDLQPSLAAQQVPVATVSRPDQYDFWSPGVWGTVETQMLDAFGDLGGAPTADAGLQYARAQVTAVDTLREQLVPFQSGYSTPAGVTYPNTELGRRFAALAAMIAGGLPLQVVAIETGGYDTHSDQAASLAPDLLEVSNCLLAFQRDVEARAIQDRVLVHVWSEFGRRPQENGSGTDHGAAGIGLVMGSNASGEMIGSFPGIEDAQLDSADNLRATSDFRALYCSLLEQWLEVDAADVIPNAGSFARPLVAV
jgi:uncharacterized protein (DUF1501 family)